jgi:uncharacterized protein YndB with AHSA1/START domain
VDATKAAASQAADTKDREILVTRVFDARREVVWDAWTDPVQVVQWWVRAVSQPRSMKWI